MKKLFTEKQIGVSALVGGPIPPGILFYLNYRRIDKEKEAYVSLAATLIFTIGLFYTLIKLPSEVIDKIPNAVITAAYGILVYVAYKKFLSKEIDSRLNEGNPKASNWSVAGMTILGLAINLVIIVGLAFNQPAFEGDKVTFGSVKNEIYFDERVTTREDVDKLGQVLINTGYFNEEYPVAVHLNTWATAYIVTLQIDKEYWENEELLEFLDALKVDLKAIYSKEITIVLEHYDLSGERSERRI